MPIWGNFKIAIFSSIYNTFSHFCVVFSDHVLPRITGTWQGRGMTQAVPCRAVSRVPLSPGFPHSRRADRDIPGTAMRLVCVLENVSQKYLQLRKARIKNEIHYLGASSIR